MYDSVTTDAIPTDAKAAAGYLNGSYANYSAVKARTPNAKHVAITVAGMATIPADCVDVEPGDATNSTATTWVKRRLAGSVKGVNGYKPIVYTSASNVGALISALSSAGVSRSKYHVWSAHYSTQHICGPGHCSYPQADATQWTSKALGRNLDESLVSPGFWS